MWNKSLKNTNLHTQTGIAVSLAELIALRRHPQLQPLKVNKWLNLPGPKSTVIRGRGIEFAATREYQAGDDIRNMAWRVTARNLKPYVKVYHEEKERPVWLALDLSPSLYFGTRAMFKSVRSIKQAAALGWMALSKREQIGALIATGDKTLLYPPQASESNFLRILNSFCLCSKLRPAFNEHNYLHQLLLTLQYKARSGNLIFILSDFLNFGSEVQKIIVHIAERTQVVLIFTYDPFEAEPPPPYQYVLTNGQKKVLFNMDNMQNRLQYQHQFQLKKNTLINFCRKHNIILQILRTDQKDE